MNAPVMRLAEKRVALVRALRSDAQAQQDGRLRDMGAEFERLDVFDDDTLESPEAVEAFRLAWEFWAGWLDEAEHGFVGFYAPMQQHEWPSVARHIADALEGHQPITHPFARAFAPSSQDQGQPPLPQRLWDWLTGRGRTVK